MRSWLHIDSNYRRLILCVKIDGSLVRRDGHIWTIRQSTLEFEYDHDPGICTWSHDHLSRACVHIACACDMRKLVMVDGQTRLRSMI
jgi:hypothetical protein